MLAALKQTKPTLWAEFAPGFEVEIRFMPQDTIREVLDNARTRKWDTRSHALVEAMDEKKYRASLVRNAVVGWRGLTGETLKQFVSLESYPKQEIEFSAQDCAWLMKEIPQFELWVQNIAVELGAFNAVREKEQEQQS